MSASQLVVCVVSIALVATKFFDCWTTATEMEDPSEEANPLARAAMVRMGPQLTIWGVFLLATLIVVFVGGSAYQAAGDPTLSSRPVMRVITVWGYVVLGVFISIVQGAVAQTNRSGCFNFVSNAVLRVTQWMSRR